MRRIIVMNTKGGCGKTTIATNLASYYASRGFKTALFDHDPQGSSSHWLRRRNDNRAAIFGVTAYQIDTGNATRAWQLRVPAETERIVIDTPAGIRSNELINYLRGVNTVLIPVLPSAIDIVSTTAFIRDLLLVAKVRTTHTRLAIIANRVRMNTKAFRGLERFLGSLNIPVVGHLRDTLNYVHAIEKGAGIHEMATPRTQNDHLEWEQLTSRIDTSCDRPNSNASAAQLPLSPPLIHPVHLYQ
ncbi:MAG: ParA family protein [Gammaproteobacteria bacterium]|nr:ParA family protein [Gammaproteobacteria bacterium]